MDNMLIFYIFVFVIGLCVGSFLNVVILRALSEESIVFPGSKCPKCQHPLKWWHNIPLFSYIFLRGKCAFCKEHISIQYPIVELLTAIIFTLIFYKYQISANTIFLWVVSSLLIAISGTDYKEKVVFDAHTYSLIGVGLVFSVIATGINLYYIHTHILPHINNIHYMTFWSNPITNAILGGLAGALILEILARTGYLIAGTRAFGEGDTYIAAGLGTVFGWQNVIVILIYSIIVQVLLFIPIFVYGMIKHRDWTTLSCFISFLIYAILLYIFQNKILMINETLYIACTIIFAILGILTSFLIFRGIKKNPQDKTYLPFGPAMAITAIAVALIF